MLRGISDAIESVVRHCYWTSFLGTSGRYNKKEVEKNSFVNLLFESFPVPLLLSSHIASCHFACSHQD